MESSVQEAITEEEIRSAVRELCARFPDEYWRRVDREEAYPKEFVDALTEAGWLAALIPAEYGGAGLGISEARDDPGGDQPLRRQRRRLPRADVHHGHAAAPRLARSRSSSSCRGSPSGELRLQAFGVTEPDAGLDTTRDPHAGAARRRPATWSTARRSGPRARSQSDLMLLLARTGEPEGEQPRWWGLSTFLVDLRAAPEREPANPADRDDAQPQHDRGVHRRPRDPGRATGSARRGWASATSSTG